MSSILKQVINFSITDELNEWLSDRKNDGYDTKILVTPYNDSRFPVLYTVIYWIKENGEPNA